MLVALSNGLCRLFISLVIFTFFSANIKSTVGLTRHLDIASDNKIPDFETVRGIEEFLNGATTRKVTSVQNSNSSSQISRFPRQFGNTKCQALNYEGTCMGGVRCWVLGGTIGPICRSLMGTCCRFLRHCGQRSSQEVIYFSNNKFDGSIQQASLGFADLPPECDFEIVKRTENYCGLRIEPYIDPDLINPDSSGGGANDESCTDSVLSIVGLKKRHEFSMCNTRDAYTRKRYDIDIANVTNLKLRLSSFSRSGSPVDVKIKQIKCEEFIEEDTSGTVIPGPGGGPEGGPSGPDGVQPPAPPIPVTDKPPAPPSPPPPGPNFAACGKKGPGKRSRVPVPALEHFGPRAKYNVRAPPQARVQYFI